MEYVNLGRSGLRVSRLCLGCMTYGKADPALYPHTTWTLDEAGSRPFIRRALELGINFFDTADYYGIGSSEEILGRALRDFARRDEVVVATKVFMRWGAARTWAACRASTSCTRSTPACAGSAPTTSTCTRSTAGITRVPIEETLEALHDVVKAGKARYIGASSMHAWQFAKALFTADLHGWTRFVSMQPQYNLVYREEEREMLPLCRDQGIGVIPWSPLARGFLAGNRNASGGSTARAQGDQFARQLYFRDDDFTVAARLGEVATARETPNMQVALAWLLSKPGVTAPIIGASQPHHLDDAVQALDLRLDAAEIERLEEPYRPHPVLGHQ